MQLVGPAETAASPGNRAGTVVHPGGDGAALPHPAIMPTVITPLE
jgi:hypothetical protein